MHAGEYGSVGAGTYDSALTFDFPDAGFQGQLPPDQVGVVGDAARAAARLDRIDDVVPFADAAVAGDRVGERRGGARLRAGGVDGDAGDRVGDTGSDLEGGGGDRGADHVIGGGG